ncbi:MAG: cell division ATPase MinD [archaeon]
MARVIAIASGKGGVGKTMLTANLGFALANFDKKVLLVDADLDMANLELVLGMEGRPITLQDVLNEEAKLDDAIYDIAQNIKFVPAGIAPSQYRRVDPEKLVNVLTQLAVKADFVLLDCPAGIGRDTQACLSAGKEVILVVTPEHMSLADAYKTKIVAEKLGSEVIGVVVNLIKGVKRELKDKEITSLLQVPILGHIKEEGLVREATLSGKPIVAQNPSHPVSQEIYKIAAYLTGSQYVPKVEKENIFKKLLKLFKR